jgi:CRP-like cAMP-binding protein
VTDSKKVPIVVAEPSDRRFPVLPPDVLEELSEFGERREPAAGDELYRAGQSNSDFFVLIDGEVEVVRDHESQELIVVYAPGQFVGELVLVTGQHAVLTARSTQNGTALVIPRDSFRRLMATKPTISDDIVGALIARRRRSGQPRPPRRFRSSVRASRQPVVHRPPSVLGRLLRRTTRTGAQQRTNIV